MPKVTYTDTPTWLITGSTGRVGKLLMNAWRSEPPNSNLIIQRRIGDRNNLLMTDSEWGLLDKKIPISFPKISCVIGYAGITPSSGADLGLNAEIAEATLKYAAEAEIPRVLITSSSAVYGVPEDGVSATESTPLRPVNDYGRSKVAMEEICGAWRDRGLEVCCLRIGNVAGADALLVNGKNSMNTPLQIDQFSNGFGPIRSYIGAVTLARATAALASHSDTLPSYLNVAAPVPVEMSKLADAADFKWEWKAAPNSACQAIILDTKLLQSFYKFTVIESDPKEMVSQWRKLSR